MTNIQLIIFDIILVPFSLWLLWVFFKGCHQQRNADKEEYYGRKRS